MKVLLKHEICEFMEVILARIKTQSHDNANFWKFCQKMIKGLILKEFITLFQKSEADSANNLGSHFVNEVMQEFFPYPFEKYRLII